VENSLERPKRGTWLTSSISEMLFKYSSSYVKKIPNKLDCPQAFSFAIPDGPNVSRAALSRRPIR